MMNCSEEGSHLLPNATDKLSNIDLRFTDMSPRYPQQITGQTRPSQTVAAKTQS